jgi:UDP-N-acetylglucosamine acyltransferase
VNRIHPTALIDPEVRLGERNVVGPYAVLCGPCEIGDGNWIGPHAVIGTPAQFRGGTHPGFDGGHDSESGPAWTDEGPGAGVVIGDGNVLRELTTVQQGRVTPTTVGSRCYVMAGAHVNHDAVVGDDVVLSNSVVLAGSAWVGDRANLGMAAVVHQFTAVGAGAMIGMKAAVRHPVPPYARARGVPARVRRANARALEARGASAEVVLALTEHFAGTGPRPDLPASLLADFDAFADATRGRGRT